MTEFEAALDDCLKRLASGEASVEDCLAPYPQFADDLRPLLSAALHVGRIAEVQPDKAFKRKTRKQLDGHMRASPRRRSPLLLRLAVIATLLLVALLVAGTAYAQGAFPGDALYRWKLASENLARRVDPIRVDMWLAQRRADEILAVRTEPARLAIAWAQYRLVMDRLLAYDDPQFRDEILLMLKRQADEFARLGATLPTGVSALQVLPTLTPTPQTTGAPTGLTPTPTHDPALGTPVPASTDALYPTATDFTLATLPPFQTNTPRPTWTPRPTRTPEPTPTRPCIGPQCP